MAKLNLPSIVGEVKAAALNTWASLIEDFAEKTVSRDNTLPNHMLDDLDMNSNRILNLPTPLTNGEPLRLGDRIDSAEISTQIAIAEGHADDSAASATASSNSATASSNSATDSSNSAIDSANSAVVAETEAEKATGVIGRLVVSNWDNRTATATNQWQDVAWGDGVGFIAVANTGTYKGMFSLDGKEWLSKDIGDSQWMSIARAPDVFCAVASYGPDPLVATSSNGNSWAARTAAAANEWRSVTWSPELGLFCAVASTGTGNRVMTSPTGATWTIRTSAADNNWYSITWSPELALFCAVAITGTGNRVMTSPDGITWTLRTSAADIQWRSVTWSPELGLFCAVATQEGTSNVMTSPDGITWTLRDSVGNGDWNSITWSPELSLFCVVGSGGTVNDNRWIMTSPDGITWTLRTPGNPRNTAPTTTLSGVTWSAEKGVFCAVGTSSTVDTCVATSMYFK